MSGSQAVRFDRYGGIDVLQVVEVPRPAPGPGQALIRVKAAGINPGESKIRSGMLHDRFPATFPSGEGSDLAGLVAAVGEGVEDFSVGDEVLGFTDNRASHATFVVADVHHLVRRPPNVSWEAAGSLFVVGTTAYAAVRAVAAGPGDTVAVSGAAGGVGSLTVQLAKDAGAAVIGLASEVNHPWLTRHGVVPVAYGEGVAERIRTAAGPGGVDAFIDTVGPPYVQVAIEQLGVRADRIDTIADFAGARYLRGQGGGNRCRRHRRGTRRPGPAHRRRKARGAHRRHLSPGRGAPGLRRARAGSHPRQDRADPLTVTGGR